MNSAQIEELKTQIKRLEAENQQLKAEKQQLTTYVSDLEGDVQLRRMGLIW